MLPVVIMVMSGNKRISFLSSDNCLRGKKPKMVEYMFEPAQNEKKKSFLQQDVFYIRNKFITALIRQI